jgi:hypothetical protein
MCLQYLLTKLGHQTFPAPGAFDGYTLVSTAFLGTGSTRLLLSVYNSDPDVLGASYPPLLVVHSDTNSAGSGGALLRVMELYKTSDSPLEDVTGVAVTYSPTGNVLVSHVDGEGAAVTAFSKATVRSLAAAGGAAVVLLAVERQGAVLSHPLSVLPLGGISFFADNGDCSMLAADGSSDEESATVSVFKMFDCDWFLPSMSSQDGTLRESASFPSGGNVTGIAVFRHSTDTLLYAAVVRCAIVRGMDCRIEFSGVQVTAPSVSSLALQALSWDFNRTVLYTLVVPAGTVSLAFDPDSGGSGFSTPRGPQFIMGCAGAAQANVMRVKSAGKFLEGRVMVLDKPIFIAIPFGVKRNIAFANFLGFDVLERRCALPLSDPCAPCEGPPCPEPPPEAGFADGSGTGSTKKRLLHVVSTQAFGHGTSRYLANSDSSGCLSFEKELFSHEEPIFSESSAMIVVVVVVEYYFEAVFLGTVNFRAKLCIPNQQVSMALVPEAAVLAKAGAAINLAVVRAGLELSTTILKLSLVPTLTLNIGKGGSVQACLDARIEIRPLRAQVRFRGYCCPVLDHISSFPHPFL